MINAMTGTADSAHGALAGACRRLRKGTWDEADIRLVRRHGDASDHHLADLAEEADRRAVEFRSVAPSEIDEKIAEMRARAGEYDEGPGSGVWWVLAIILGGMFWAWVLRDIAPAAIHGVARSIQWGGMIVQGLLS